MPQKLPEQIIKDILNRPPRPVSSERLEEARRVVEDVGRPVTPLGEQHLDDTDPLFDPDHCQFV